jgi:hypothetical protein
MFVALAGYIPQRNKINIKYKTSIVEACKNNLMPTLWKKKPKINCWGRHLLFSGIWKKLGAKNSKISHISAVSGQAISNCFKLRKIVHYLTNSCVNWAFLAWVGQTSVLKTHECQKKTNLHKNGLNTTFFCSTGPLKAPFRLKSLK